MANEVNLELSEHQQSLGTSVRDLSSGLRVNTAADDPSGNAIASSLQTHAQAFNQASQNVTNAQNAGTVADGALATVTDILLRIRELAVGAASTVDSASDRVNIQTEIGQLLLEINRIAQNTNFNGRALLDGSIAGYQPGQNAQTIVTSNSVLMNGASASAPSSFLLASAAFYNNAIEAPVEFGFLHTVTPSAAPQTVQVDSTTGLAPGDIFAIGNTDLAAGNYFTPTNGIFTIQSVDPANDTITAVFSATIAAGNVGSGITNSPLVAGVAAGTQIATLANPSPLYAGELVTIDYSNLAKNQVVVVQKVLSSTSFVATFTQPVSAGEDAYAGDEIGEGAGTLSAGDFTLNAVGYAWDGAPIGSAAYVVENIGAVTEVVGQGTVVGGGVTSTVIDFPQTITVPGPYMIMTASGLGTIPVVNSVDGTIKLTVVNASGAIGVQESFYDTATQTSVTSPYLLTPGERAMLYDGVVTTLGNFGASDVGSTAYIKVLQSVAPTLATTTPALQVQSGADEGDVIQIAIPAVNTNTLRVSTVTVIGASGSDPTLASEDAIGQCDYALQQVTTLRAQIGAEIVRLGIDQTNDDTAATELTASQSNITDLNIGSATTEFTEQQIDIEVATSMLSQVNNLQDELLRLFQQQAP
jgi:flagellin